MITKPLLLRGERSQKKIRRAISWMMRIHWTLFAGYSVAGKRLRKQLEDQGIKVDEDHRLYVYIPCGVGGAPGGVTYGIKKYFGDDAYCFFAEPTHAPCMTLGLITGFHNGISASRSWHRREDGSGRPGCRQSFRSGFGCDGEQTQWLFHCR